MYAMYVQTEEDVRWIGFTTLRSRQMPLPDAVTHRREVSRIYKVRIWQFWMHW